MALWQGLSVFIYLSKPWISPIPAGVTLEQFTDLLRYPLSEMDLIITYLFRLLTIFWLSVSFWFLNLVYTFFTKRRDMLFWLFAVAVAGSILISLSTNRVVIRPLPYEWGVDEMRGPFFAPLAFLSSVLPGIYGIILVLQRRRKVPEEIEKRQLLLLAVGGVFVLAVGIFTDVLLPQLFGITELPGLAGPSGAVQAIIILVAVLRYGLFSPGAVEVAGELFLVSMKVSSSLTAWDRYLKSTAVPGSSFD